MRARWYSRARPGVSDGARGRPALSTGLFAFDDCAVYPLPQNQVLVRNPRNGAHSVMQPEVYSALLDCREFRSLEGHIEHLARSNDSLAGQKDRVLAVLESARQDGFLISADIYREILAPSARQVAHVDKPVVALLTWERPDAMKRCLESMVANCNLENTARIYVIDDSRSQQAQQQNRLNTDDFARRCPVPVIYVGAVEIQKFMERLIKRVPSLEDAVRFLIDREHWAPYWTCGLSRTVALLLSVGERLIVMDDDILCEVYEFDVERTAARFGTSARDVRFFGHNDEWAPYRVTENGDPLARHTRLLGLGLADALSGVGVTGLDASSFAGASPGFLERLSAESPVLVTEAGSVGHPGTPSCNWLMSLGAESMARLLASEESVRQAIEIRNCWTGRHHLQVTERSLISQMTGMDNRRLLPPNIPVSRGEDLVFGSMTSFLFPRSVALEQCWAAPHLPLPERPLDAKDRAFLAGRAFPIFFMTELHENPPPCTGDDPLKRYARMAQVFTDLADLAPGELVRYYQHRKLEQQSRDYCHLKHLREKQASAPRAWLTWLDRAIRELHEQLVRNPADLQLRGFPENLAGDRLGAWWQLFWRRLAHALQAWPAIRQAARHCRPELDQPNP